MTKERLQQICEAAEYAVKGIWVEYDLDEDCLTPITYKELLEAVYEQAKQIKKLKSETEE